MTKRDEQDSLGVIQVPEGAYYGAQTERARINFIDSGLKPPPAVIHTIAVIKGFAAEVNLALGRLRPDLAKAVAKAAREVMAGKFQQDFVVDLFQTGSGTSTNMNVNEVIAGRANELLTGRRGGKEPVHPNDHVNLGQSSNDVFPSAMHVAAMTAVHEKLLPSLKTLQQTLSEKAAAFGSIRKIGRTHLQDAVPIMLGDEFGGYARQVDLAAERIESASDTLRELALGGTAVGNGLNTHSEFAERVIAKLSKQTGLEFKEAVDHFEAQGAKDAAVALSGSLRSAAVGITKIANDIRLMSSGPRCGIGEITLPSLQPGSSIMPGKVNPVILESMLQICTQVIGNDTVVMLAGQGGVFELNTMMPVMAYNLMQSIELLALGAGSLAEKCINGIAANAETCAAYVDKSLAIATYLVPAMGYDRAAAVSKKAHRTGKSIREVVLEAELMSGEAFDDLLKT
ncbi:MAG: class II fumarate hydratase [Deltaproteobacteria bacterium]